MAAREASDVAKRCLCLELLLQRLGVEIDQEDPVTERDAVRRAWLSRLGQLGIENALFTDERALLDRAIGGLTEEECEGIEDRLISGLVLLWALGRIPAPPAVDILNDATTLIAEHGILGDGSISAAKAAVAGVTLRPEAELRAAIAAYQAKRQDPSAEATGEEAVADLGLHALSWVVDRDAALVQDWRVVP